MVLVGFGERVKINGMLLLPVSLEAYALAWPIPSLLSKSSSDGSSCRRSSAAFPWTALALSFMAVSLLIHLSL